MTDTDPTLYACPWCADPHRRPSRWRSGIGVVGVMLLGELWVIHEQPELVGGGR